MDLGEQRNCKSTPPTSKVSGYYSVRRPVNKPISVGRVPEVALAATLKDKTDKKESIF
jgi:hypothetical protein